MFHMRSGSMVGIALASVLALGIAAPALSELTVDWWTLDGGGALNLTGGNFTVSGTIGQADATTSSLTGGDLTLRGGFWVVVAETPDYPPGDCNGDGVVDLADFTLLCGCPLEPGGDGGSCACFDLDLDGDVDCCDFARFQRQFTGN